MEAAIYRQLQQLRETVPLVQNITNFVVMNNTANALLAVGASPIMVHAKEEIDDVLRLANSLVINIGTLSPIWIESMLKAADLASSLGKPWVLDPVGAGISTLRNDCLRELLSFAPTVVRGNASEILAIHNLSHSGGKGVDSTADSRVALNAAKELNRHYGSIICISGETDYIVSHDNIVEVTNGNALMTKVTGLGCTASALIAAFLGLRKNSFQETIAGVAITSLAGELAAQIAAGPGTLQLHLYDCLYNLDQKTLVDRLNLKQYAIAS